MKLRLFLSAILFPAIISAQTVEDDSVYSNARGEEPLFGFIMPPTTLGSLSPYSYWDMWNLHEGVNARFSFGAAVGFGKCSPKGVGLEERVDLAYAGKWGKRWKYAVMLQGSNTTWGPVRRRDISLTGIVGYRASERFSLYAYFTKSLIHSGGASMFFPLYGEPAVDRVGIVADWTLGENSWLQIAVEASRVKYESVNPFCNLHQLYGPPPMKPYNW